MRAKFTSLLTVIGAVTVLVLAANTVALAATGHGFILGKSNSANKETTLSRTTSGSVLSLHSKSASNAPLTVNGRGKVTNLNADLLDGLDSTAIRAKTYLYTVPTETNKSAVSVTFPHLPPGLYRGSYSVVMGTSSTNPIYCYFSYSDLSYSVINYGVSQNQFSSVNGSGVVDTRNGRTVDLLCQFFASGNKMSTTQPASEVSFTQLNSVSSAMATDAP